MLSSPVFACTESRNVYTFYPKLRGKPRSAKVQHRSVPPATPRALIPASGQTVCELVSLKTPTHACISFLFNHSSSLHLRRPPTGRYLSPLFPCPCGCFPSQQRYTPPRSPSARRGRKGPIVIEGPPSSLGSWLKIPALPPWRAFPGIAASGLQHPTVSGMPQLGYPMPLPIFPIAGRASAWEG